LERDASLSDRTARIHVEVDLPTDPTPVRLEAHLVADIRWDDRASVCVSHAPALDVYSQGRTEREALHAIESAVRLYFVTAHAHGFLRRILARLEAERAFDGISPLKDYVRILDSRAPVEPVAP
jgi:predicted RNase H-like HicB family nuclease